MVSDLERPQKPESLEFVEVWSAAMKGFTGFCSGEEFRFGAGPFFRRLTYLAIVDEGLVYRLLDDLADEMHVCDNNVLHCFTRLYKTLQTLLIIYSARIADKSHPPLTQAYFVSSISHPEKTSHLSNNTYVYPM